MIKIDCKKCELSITRRNIVIGRGDIPADILLLSEAPGQAEDVLGIPFVGESGKLLDKMIEVLREDLKFYFSNIVLCHPCDTKGERNRSPKESEILSCFQNIIKIKEEVNPKLTIFIGKTAELFYKNIFKPNETILHPSFLLRTGGVGSPYYLQTINKLNDILEKYFG